MLVINNYWITSLQLGYGGSMGHGAHLGNRQNAFLSNTTQQKLFLITLNMFVTDPNISQFKMGKHANHNGYVDFFTDLTKTVWDKRKVLHA